MKFIYQCAIFVLALTVPVLSLAAEFRAGENVSIGREEKISNDLYMAAGSITSAGVVHGDLIIGGGNIVITGDVKADIIAGGGNVNILSNIGDDVRVGGGTVVVNGKIGGDLITGGGQISILGSGIGGDAVIGGGNIRIDAPVAGNLLVGGGNVYINAPIGGNVKIEAEKITLGKNAVISGNLAYRSSEEMVKEAGAIVKGRVDFEPLIKKSVSPKIFAAVFSAFLLWKFFALLVCGLVIGLLLRRYSNEIVALAVKRPLLELGRGVITLIVMPVASIFLLITLVGIPFGIAGLLGFVIIMIFSWIITPIIIGSIVYRYFSKKALEISWKTILLGVFLYMLLGFIPFIGSLARTLLILLSLGVISGLKLRVLKEWR